MHIYTTNKKLKGAIFVENEREFWNLIRAKPASCSNEIICFIPSYVNIRSRESIRKALKAAQRVLEESMAELIYLGADVSRHTKSITSGLFGITLANCFYTCGYVTTVGIVKSFKRRFYGSTSTIEENICFHVKTAIFKKNIVYHDGYEQQRSVTFAQVYNRYLAHIS